MGLGDGSTLEYRVERTGNDILFRDGSGNQVALVRSTRPNGYSVFDSSNRQIAIYNGMVRTVIEHIKHAALLLIIDNKAVSE